MDAQWPLVEQIARVRDPERFRPLAPEVKRHLGIRMAPFLESHPVLLRHWMMARETAISLCPVCLAILMEDAKSM
jgi:hypothetical protein